MDKDFDSFSKPHLHHWTDYGTTYSALHLQTCGGKEGYQEKSAWVDQR